MWIVLGYLKGKSIVGLTAIEDFYRLTMGLETKRMLLKRGSIS
jgi:hypothetical protein